jgi:hypothetical protein
MSAVAGIIILIGRILFVIFPAYISGYSFHVKSSNAASVSIALGIWPDLGALMMAVFVVPAAWYFHRFWEVEDPNQKQAQTMFFYRNVIILGACLMLFGFFASVGDALRFAVTGSLFDLSP